ncbi:MAG: IS21 family transposase [Nitrospiraceae bacterium]|nr:IS21 family transposase [Nitrospiraceae bacterium]
MESPLQSRARHLLEVEGLSLTQAARALGVSRKKITRLVRQNNLQRKPRESIISPYEGLIGQWYKQYPFLQAIQVLERLRPYGYAGGYSAVKRYTRQFRTRRPRESFHELSYLPGEESQVDWMHWNTPFGVVYGFVYLLAYSRYLYVTFYPRSSMEFFLDGHIGAFKEIGGVAHRHKYDNLKSVVISRKPDITYNARFMDFARYYGFKIYACTPGRANEKGRVERAIRDIENGFLRAESFSDLADLNRKVSVWRTNRNNREHRSTGKAPSGMFKEEKLKALPRTPYQPYRHEPALISKTGFITADTNRYSVPSGYCGQHCDLLIYPWQIEVVVGEKKIAQHDRRFDRHQKIEHPGHRRGLLDRTPHFKNQRIYQLMKGMDASIERFLAGAEQEGQAPLAVAYELFKLLKGISKGTLISAVREANGIPAYKTTYIRGLLSPAACRDNPVHPQNTGLLSIDYEGRSLDDYDTFI